MEHFNQLTPAQAERLALLAEECGECIQVIGKILRHGFDSHHPAFPAGPSNRKELIREIGDINVAVGLLTGARDIEPHDIQEREFEKAKSVRKYLHHQEWICCLRGCGKPAVRFGGYCAPHTEQFRASGAAAKGE